MARLAFHSLAILLVLLGARGAVAQQEPFDYAKWREFWSFKLVIKPQPPVVKNKTWGRNAIDAFIVEKLETQGLAPAPQADRHTLIRRATFDLTGLPPTLAEIEAFIKDTSPDAYERLITRLLASPHYGERQGRHWLDVVRYEQGKVKLPGIKNTRGELDFRDYIVRSFNSDKPYNQLILEHLAGDLLPPTENREQYFDQITAPAFLSIGNWFDECTDPNRLKLDIIDEQINAVSKAFMGLTVSCARCHDHKYDPITERDYYALAGIFASTRIIDEFNENWKDGRVRLTREKATPAQVLELVRHQKAIDDDRKAMETLVQKVHARSTQQWKKDEDRYRALARTLPKTDVVEIEAEHFAGQSNLKITSLTFDDRDIEVIESQSLGDQWVKYECDIPADGIYVVKALAAPGHTDKLQWVTKDELLPAKAHPLSLLTPSDWNYRAWVTVGIEEFEKGRRTLRINLTDQNARFPRIDRLRLVRFTPAWVVETTRAVRDTELSAPVLQRILIDPTSPFPTAAESFWVEANNEERELAGQLNDRIHKDLETLGNVERILAATDHDQPTDLPIHIGGDTYRVSKAKVIRSTPTLFEHAVKPPVMPANQSGRLELAQWLADPKHPLTARVMVNRLWQAHFGKGIVDSPNDFGSRGSAPSHPQLLDWLAATFIEEGWSMKKMHYHIMTSAAYMQSSEFRVPSSELGRAADSATQNSKLETRNFFSPFPRRRLEVEAIYDAMLATTGKVARQPAGQPLDFTRSADRMMYVLTANRSPVGMGNEIRKMFAVFDYDPTGEPLGRRDSSTTAAQSLFWLNNPLPKYFAGEFAKQILRDTRFNDAELLRRLSLTALGREPDQAMLGMMLNHLKTCEKQGISREAAWTELCLAIYASNEFRYLD